VDEKDEDKEDSPAREGADPAGEAPLIKEKPDGERANDLGDPVDDVVQGTGTDVEKGTIVVVKFCKVRDEDRLYVLVEVVRVKKD